MTRPQHDQCQQPVRRAADADVPARLFGQGAHGWPGAGQCWKRLVVCGDDFGMNAGIDAGMLRLARLGRLSAISCLTQGPTFAAHAGSLNSADLDLG
ncbi:MAG TPA: ChbG/HpnK family deacetylase, partial [Bordetella sp.]|nr:ChbG/HpnK family deacetylase [Bordetella sp.]